MGNADNANRGSDATIASVTPKMTVLVKEAFEVSKDENPNNLERRQKTIIVRSLEKHRVGYHGALRYL